MKKEEEEIIDAEVEKVAGGQPEEQKGAYKNALMDVLAKGMTIMQAIGFPPGLLELIYSYASELYSAGKYQDANALFFFLCQLNPRDTRFLFGCAASFHKLKRMPEASTYYLMASSAEPTNPLPLFHAADCFLQAGQAEASIVLLDKAIDIAADASQYQKMKQQALALRDVIQQSLGKQE